MGIYWELAAAYGLLIFILNVNKPTTEIANCNTHLEAIMV